MHVIVITPDFNVEGETDTINSMFAMGLDRLHIRKPSFDTRAYSSYIAAIRPAFHPKIFVHGSYELYTEMALGGIHLNGVARANESIWNIIFNIPPSAVSTSFHAWDEVLDNRFAYGNVFISPVFDSISKPGYNGSININEIAAVRKMLGEENRYCPAITALGGVDKSGIQTLKQHGFDGAALLGAIWNNASPVAAFLETKTAIDLAD